MTEFKKLKDLLYLQLKPNCDRLFSDPSLRSEEDHERGNTDTHGLPIEELHALMLSTQALFADGAARFLKLVAKARETNPDKQIFNEKTSQSIIDEYTVFVSVMAKFYEIEAALAENEAPAFVPVGGDEDTVSSPSNAWLQSGYAEGRGGGHVESRTSVESTAGGVSVSMAEKAKAGIPAPLTPEQAMEERLQGIETSAPTKEIFLEWDLGPKLCSVELRFARAVIEKAQREADRNLLLGSLQSVEEAEVAGRQLIVMTEKSVFHTEIVPKSASSKLEARSRQHAREEQLYLNEIQRRKDETVDLASRVSAPQILMLSLAAVKDTLTSPAVATVNPSAYKTFQRTILDLVGEVINRPENDTIRIIKTDHHRAVASFGHPAIDEGKELYRHMETILGCVGYTIAYTKQPAHSARTPQHVAELGLGMDLPQGNVKPIHYTPLGYEKYSERLLVFQEPDPAEDASAWCEWHDKATSTTQALRDALTQK